MNAVQDTPDMAYRIFMFAVGCVVLGWAIAYGYANYQGDECVKSVELRLESLKARVAPMKPPNQAK